MGERNLMVLEIFTGLAHQPATINKKTLLACLFQRSAELLMHEFGEEITNTRTSFTSAVKQNTLVLQTFSSGTESSHNARNSDGSCTLNIVIEAAHLLSVIIQQSKGISVTEILKLNHDMGLPCFQGIHELTDKLIEFHTRNAFVTDALVGWIFEKSLVISTNVKTNGKGKLWADTTNCSIKLNFTLTDTHAISSQVTKTKDAFSIGDDNNPNRSAGI
mmetsp:Transcript_33427/g.60388  ORF Transcript_33427/g.60388 Transcript_33427/m.60388 type:complete len:218 (+) Transcript_33427:1061-1714(+)